MPGKDVPAVSAALTVDGTSGGLITVASNAGFYVGAQAFMAAAGQTPVEVRITDLVSSTQIGIKIVPVPVGDHVLHSVNYGRSSAAAFTVAGGWSIFQPQQFIYSAT